MSLKNVLIFGDSYSTFKGYVPDGYAIYYSENERPETDVRRVTDTWWHQVIEETNSNLVLNNSWSGSTICYTGYNGTDCSETSSFICRLNKLTKENFFKENEINTILIFGGTNDNWANAPVGELKYEAWQKEDLYSVLPAVCYFINELQKALPEGRIIWLINTELKDEISNGMKAACKHYGIESIEFESITKNFGHPTIKGMQDIKTQVLNSI